MKGPTKMAEPEDTINVEAEVSNTAAPDLEVTSEEEQKPADPDNSQPQVPTSDCTRKDLLNKYNRLEDEVALLRMDLDTVRCQSQDMEKKYLENIEIVKGKSDDLQRTIKENAETERQTIFQRNEQLNNLKAEIRMLSLELENLKQSKARPETELEPHCARPETEFEPYCARLDLAPAHHYEIQTPGRDLEFTLQETSDEYFNSQAKIDFDICNLKVHSEVVNQQLSRNKIKICSLENELCQTTDALKEMTLVLENVQRDLKVTQYQLKIIEQSYQNEQSKVNKYTGKQESTEERVSQLQDENTLPQQHDLHYNADNKEETVITVLHRFHDIVKVLLEESEKYSLMLENRIMGLINSCNHFEERLYKKYEKEKAEREVNDEASKYLHLDTQYESFQKQFLSLQSLQNICEKLEKNQNKWEKYILEISRHLEKNIVEQGQGAWHAEATKHRVRQDSEENQKQTQAPAQENSEQLRENNDAALSQMELRIQDLESKLSKMKTENYSQIVEGYKEFYLGETTIIESLSAEVKNLLRRNERLEELNIRLLEEKHQSRSFRCPIYRRPVPELSCVRNQDSSQGSRGSLSPRENLGAPTSHPQPARKSMEDYLAEMEQAVDKSLTRALEEVTTEFESGPARTSTPKSTNKSSKDLLLEAQQEYTEILKKKYMI